MIVERTSDHAAKRLAQRGIRKEQVELAAVYGSDTGDGFYVCEKTIDQRIRDCDREIQECRSRKRALERIKGHRIVMVGSTQITGYKAGRSKGKALRRLIRENGGEIEEWN